MLDKLDWVHPRVEELGALLSDPAVVQDQEKWRALMREHSQLEPLDAAVKRYAQMLSEREEAKTMLADADMAAMAREELLRLDEEIPACEREIQLLLLPRDPNDERNVVMEIRGGAGGEDGLDFYRRISREAGAYLSDGGVLLFEIGWKQKDAVATLLARHIGEPFALRDYGDNWRVVGAVKERRDA